MTARWPTVRLGLVVLLALLAGCAGAPSSPSLFVLDVGAPADHDTPKPDAPTLMVAPVAMATYLKQSGIVYQTGPHRVTIANNNRWASPLAGQLTEGLYAILNRRLSAVDVVHASGDQGGVYKLVTHVDRFLGEYDGQAHIVGRWTLVGPGGKKLAARAFTENVSLAADGYPALVSSLSTGWNNVGRDIAPAVAAALASKHGS